MKLETRHSLPRTEREIAVGYRRSDGLFVEVQKE